MKITKVTITNLFCFGFIINSFFIKYIPPRVKIEISCLSMNEPTEDRLISSYIEQTFPGEDAAATATVRTVVPTRTFLEKAFLLCEEFQKQTPRHVRMSRHLYDLERLMDTGFGKQALQDIDLKTMKRIIDSTLVILSLMLIFGCKESKVGQGNPTKDSMSIDTDSVISGKVFNKQDIASEDTLNAVIKTQSPKSKDFDFEVFIMRGEKTVQIIPFSYPKDDTFDPNGGRKDSCLMTDVTFDGNKDLLVYLGQFGNQGVEYWDAYVWNEVKQKFLFVPSFHDIPNPTLNEKEKIIESFSRGSAVDYEFGKWKFEKGVFVQKELLSHPPRECE